jgi:protein dithiol oxidoreductase (disulfide-forming)
MRRQFVRTSVAAVCGAGLSAFASGVFAQAGGPQLGKHYRAIKPALGTDDPKKIEVIEFFWFGCPHCFALEPLLEDWAKKLPADVAFRKEHVGFPNAAKHQQLFYTLKALGLDDKLGNIVFNAIHKERKPLLQVADMAALVSANAPGVDAKKFSDTFESFSVKTRMRRAISLSDSYGLEGVPAFAVNGKFFTAPSMAGSNGAALQVIDTLVAGERKRA